MVTLPWNRWLLLGLLKGRTVSGSRSVLSQPSSSTMLCADSIGIGEHGSRGKWS